MAKKSKKAVSKSPLWHWIALVILLLATSYVVAYCMYISI